MACTANPWVIKLRAWDRSTFLKFILECGSEVLGSSSSCSKARSCKACLGFLWDALWAVACGMGIKSFFRNWLCCWLCSFPVEIWTVFYLFSCFIGRNPTENTWSDTITACAFKTMGMPQLPGELGRSQGVSHVLLGWLQTIQGTRYHLNFSAGLSFEQPLSGSQNRPFPVRLRALHSQNVC